MDPNVGKKLSQARKAKELTLEEISNQLHIRVAYLQALESGELQLIPSQTQAKGFIRTYAKFLELDASSLLDEPLTSVNPKPKLSADNPPGALPLDHETSHIAIFKDIGESIRRRRDIIGLSKDDIEAHTRIPVHYVDYIENGNFDSFPSPAQARGMLNNYLQFLEINPDELLNRYAEALQIRLLNRQQQPPDSGTSTSSQPPPRRIIRIPQWVRRFLSPDLILISAVGIIIVGLTIWGIGRISRTQSELAPVPTAPSLVEALLPTPTISPTATSALPNSTGENLLEVENPEGDNPTPIPTVQLAPGAALEVFIIVRQRTYLRITADGERVFEGRTSPGSNLTFSAKDEIRVLTGNAAAIQIYFNDQDQGILGIYGEVVELFFTTDGVIRPTKEPTPTTLATEEPTPTTQSEPTEEVDLPPEENTPVP